MIMEQMMENIYNTYQNTCKKKSKIKTTHTYRGRADVLGIGLLVFRYTPHLLCLNENIPQEI